MGQNESIPALRLQNSSTDRTYRRNSRDVQFSNTSKKLTIFINDQHLIVNVPDDTLTCGWLLSEVIRLYEGPHIIVALRTRSNTEILDYWLTMYERTLHPLRESEILDAVLASPVPAQVSPAHFQPIKLVGKGGFSKVIQARKKDTGELYAIKIMDKDFILREDKAVQIMIERQIMTRVNHPFIVNLFWAFQTEKELHLVMDLCPGGELFFHLHNLNRFTEDQARFYFGEIVLGIEYLHSLNIVYRDLKPENILLDIDGHIRLTDFGLSKLGVGQAELTYSFCGSPEYMSPEMLRQSGHGRSVDFYSLGALLYEMLTGLPPFYDRNHDRMFKRVLEEDLKLPNFLSKDCKSLLIGLLQKNPDHRLGSARGIEEIKEHPWCAKIRWSKLYHKRIAPPFRPNLRVSNFDPLYTKQRIETRAFLSEQLESASPYHPAENDIFNGFDYCRPDNRSFIEPPSQLGLSVISTRSAGSYPSNLSITLTRGDQREYKEEISAPNIKCAISPNSSTTMASDSSRLSDVESTNLSNPFLLSKTSSLSELRTMRDLNGEGRCTLPLTNPIPKDAKPAIYIGSEERCSLRIKVSTPKGLKPPRSTCRSTVSTPKSENAKVKGKKSPETMINKIPNFYTEMAPNRRPSNSHTPSNVKS